MSSQESGSGSEESGGSSNAAISQQRRGTKRKASEAWSHFEKFPVRSDGVGDAKCNHCKKILTWGQKYGTTHLMKHLMFSCPCYKLADTRSGARTVSPRAEFHFDQMLSRRIIARFCIRHQYPFNIVELEEFVLFCKSLNPEFVVPCRGTVRSDVIDTYLEEKIKMQNILDELQCKVSLTTDIWTSDHSHTPYLCLTAHFIDDSWVLRKKILAFKVIPFPHDGQSLYVCLRDLIVAWNLDQKMISVVVDNASNNNSMMTKLTKWLVDESLVPFGGDLLHVRCSAHILNLIVQDGLSIIKGSIENIRDTVRYLNKSSFGRQKFEEVKRRLRLEDARAVAMDVPHRWNSTFQMLDTALPLKTVFSRLEVFDKNYCYNPSAAEWEVIEVVHKLLQVFYNATKDFSATKYPTCNVFFPDICDIHLKLIEWGNSRVDVIRNMSLPMKEKFTKYWEKCNLILAVGVVFDPRLNMGYINFIYPKIYGDKAEDEIKRVRDAVDDLFILYGGSVPTSSTGNVGSSSAQESASVMAFEQHCNESQPGVVQKSELETYFEEKRYPHDPNFKVLDWWKANALRLPVMGKIARDVLAVPVTTVASEAAFSVGGRVLDATRSSLLPDAVEAVVVTADWITSLPSVCETMANVVETNMESIVAMNMESAVPETQSHE